MIRLLDFIFSIVGVILLLPLFIVIAFIIKVNSSGPVLYKQSRVGLGGAEINVFKFRSMRLNSDKLGLITVGGHDPRVTSVGYFLRKYKLDELPQLINVLAGDMSLVGPRPEVKKYVDLYTQEQRKVLSIRPGITDWASIYYRDENVVLGRSSDPEKDYIEKVMVDKLKYNLIYIHNYGVVEYFKIIFTTIWHIIIPASK
ncbi:MAG: putative colanic biosynthesis UDP-glucose lipid carrier transferase [Bacteroidota bacterium]|jgi:lipopolysaccharide/colanic/teichoic acid biosynthesis glycosyltransferase